MEEALGSPLDLFTQDDDPRFVQKILSRGEPFMKYNRELLVADLRDELEKISGIVLELRKHTAMLEAFRI